VGLNRLALVTVIGGDEWDYEFLLGTLRYHLAARPEVYLIWETGERPARIDWPEGVVAQHHPIYGTAPAFDYGGALNDACAWLADHYPWLDGVLRLDACEYMPRDWRAAEVVRSGKLARVGLLHHLTPVWAILRRERDSRVVGWPSRRGVRHTRGYHPVVIGTDNSPSEGNLTADTAWQRLRMAMGPRSTAPPPEYWALDSGGVPVRVAHPWPDPLLRWRMDGIRPSMAFVASSRGEPGIF
jgi:hypothetical protein